jgi:hypothetical protein
METRQSDPLTSRGPRAVGERLDQLCWSRGGLAMVRHFLGPGCSAALCGLGHGQSPRVVDREVI